MSAEKTDVDKQAREHAAPLSGMAVLVAAVFLGFLVWFAWVFTQGEDPGDVSVSVETAAPVTETTPVTEPAPVTETAPATTPETPPAAEGTLEESVPAETPEQTPPASE